MNEISFVNAGYNVREFKNLRFTHTLHQHAFLYFQGPAIVEGKKVDSGACILYPAYISHNYETCQGFVNSYIGFFAPSELFSKLSIKTGKIIYPDNCEEINKIIHMICTEDTDRKRGYEEAISSLIMQLLVAISRGTQAKTSREKTEDSKLALSIIREKYLSDLISPPDICELIKESGFSRTQFYRLYNNFFHVSPKDDLIWARLNKAKDIIKNNPHIKMFQVAENCGFSDLPHFFRLFKKRYGYTPKEYALAALSVSEDE